MDYESFAKKMIEIVRGYVASSVKAIEARLADVEIATKALPKQGEPGKDGRDGVDGKDGTSPAPEAVAAALRGVPEFVESVRGKDGRDGVDGKDGTSPAPEDIAAVLRDTAAFTDLVRGAPGKDGASPTPEAVAELLRAAPEFVEWCRGKDGTNGKDGVDGKDGTSPAPEAVAEVLRASPDFVESLRGATGKDGANGTCGRDGEDGRDAVQIDILGGIDEAKRYHRGVYAHHRGGLLRAIRATDPLALHDGAFEKAGWDVVVRGVADMIAVVSEDFRTFKFGIVFTDGQVIEREFNTPAMVHRGIWTAGVKYAQGDVVTYDNSQWVAKAAGEGKPGSSPDWHLTVRKGRDGKDGQRGDRGPEGKAGKDGKDLTQLGPDGARW